MKAITFSLLAIMFIPLLTFGQAKIEREAVYRRSSLYPFMIVEQSRKYADVIQKTFFESPIPDKFNDHILESRSIENSIPEELKKRDEKINAQQENIYNFLNTNNIAKEMVKHTFFGSAKLIQDTGKHPGQLKDLITSPGGTAITGIHTLEKGGLRNTLIDAIEASTCRATELSKKA